jgi:hypothetical protein
MQTGFFPHLVIQLICGRQISASFSRDLHKKAAKARIAAEDAAAGVAEGAIVSVLLRPQQAQQLRQCRPKAKPLPHPL